MMRPASAAGVVLAHPSGNQFFRHLAMSLRDAGRLAAVCTAIDWRAGRWAETLLPRTLAGELGRRSFSRPLNFPVETHPWREFGRLVSGRLGLCRLSRHESGPLSVDAVHRDFDRWVAGRLTRWGNASVAYGYEDAAESILTAAGRLGWTRAYDLPIAYWETSQRLLAEEAERWPEWEPTLGGTRDSRMKLERKTRELELADVVVCPSRFVAESLPGWARTSKRVVTAAFGSPGAEEAPAGNGGAAAPDSPGRKLRVLFAGAMSQRKGLADLFAAARLLSRSDVEWVVLGSPAAPMEFYRRQFSGFIHEAPRPHREVLALMRTCDILCLPSIVEGRALVVQEAMSQGLPAIVTPNTGTGDVVADGRAGFVIPIRSAEAIAEKIGWFADHREQLEKMRRWAREAAARVTWSDYGAAIAAALSSP